MEGAVAAIKQSKANAQAAVASWATGRCDLARNRDLVLDSETFLCSVNPDGPSDDTVLVGLITDMSGKIIATMVNYACHPVSLGGGNKMISPDYYGAMREVVERDTGGAPCFFLHGASGDMTPLRSYESRSGHRRPEWPSARRLCRAFHPDRHAAAGAGNRF